MNAYFAGNGLSKTFATPAGRQRVLEDLSITLDKGKIVAILGESGCGKSTLLNILAGFVKPDKGMVSLEGRKCILPGPDRAFVFQSGALFPWLTALENVKIGLKVAGMDKKKRAFLPMEMLELTGLAGHEHKLPDELSGGMRQRVALARVLAMEPKVLLMDEPFAALDTLTKARMQDLLLNLQRRFNMSIIMVTHDATEARRLADSVFIMADGGIRLD